MKLQDEVLYPNAVIELEDVGRRICPLSAQASVEHISADALRLTSRSLSAQASEDVLDKAINPQWKFLGGDLPSSLNAHVLEGCLS